MKELIHKIDQVNINKITSLNIHLDIQIVIPAKRGYTFLKLKKIFLAGKGSDGFDFFNSAVRLPHFDS